MSDKSNIEWTDATWNPVTGCDKVSPGCTNCYAGALAEKRLARLPQYKDGFFGNVQCHPHKLSDPLKWRKPRMIFVNSMSDLFHPEVPFKFIGSIFHIMALCSEHTFQILTKRPERMMQWVEWIKEEWPFFEEVNSTLNGQHISRWPLPNVWLGVSCEDQKRADERIPLLLQCPAAVRFVSLEPLLGPIDLEARQNYLPGMRSADGTRGPGLFTERYGYRHKLDWVIVGGESGPKARPMDPAWAGDLRDQCVAAGVPFFFKQWHKKGEGRLLDGREWNDMPKIAPA